MNSPAGNPQNDRVQRLHSPADLFDRPVNQGVQPNPQSIEAAGTTANRAVTTNEQEGTKEKETVTNDLSQEKVTHRSHSSLSADSPSLGNAPLQNAARIESSPTPESHAATEFDDESFMRALFRERGTTEEEFKAAAFELMSQAKWYASRTPLVTCAMKGSADYRAIERSVGIFRHRGGVWLWKIIETRAGVFELRTFHHEGMTPVASPVKLAASWRSIASA
jgi:hypothetical protein